MNRFINSLCLFIVSVLSVSSALALPNYLDVNLSDKVNLYDKYTTVKARSCLDKLEAKKLLTYSCSGHTRVLGNYIYEDNMSDRYQCAGHTGFEAYDLVQKKYFSLLRPQILQDKEIEFLRISPNFEFAVMSGKMSGSHRTVYLTSLKTGEVITTFGSEEAFSPNILIAQFLDDNTLAAIIRESKKPYLSKITIIDPRHPENQKLFDLPEGFDIEWILDALFFGRAIVKSFGKTLEIFAVREAKYYSIDLSSEIITFNIKDIPAPMTPNYAIFDNYESPVDIFSPRDPIEVNGLRFDDSVDDWKSSHSLSIKKQMPYPRYVKHAEKCYRPVLKPGLSEEILAGAKKFCEFSLFEYQEGQEAPIPYDSHYAPHAGASIYWDTVIQVPEQSIFIDLMAGIDPPKTSAGKNETCEVTKIAYDTYESSCIATTGPIKELNNNIIIRTKNGIKRTSASDSSWKIKTTWSMTKPGNKDVISYEEEP